MVVEVCARFHGYPSEYFKAKTFGDLQLDHEAALLLAESEERVYKEQGNAD
jgi:hypothetical protein